MIEALQMQVCNCVCGKENNMNHGVSSYHRFLQGDESALELLVREYSDALVRYAYCFLQDWAASEDVMEETIVALVLKPKHFANDAAFHTYLYRVARNKCLDVLRSKRHDDVPLCDVEQVLSFSGETQLLERLEREQLYKSMQKLPADYRDVLCLCYFEGFSVLEMTKILHKTKKQIYNLLERAKKTLKKLLIKEGYYENLSSTNK